MWCALDNYFSKEKLHSTIVNRVEWLWNPSDFFAVYFCGPGGAQKDSITFLSFWSYWPIKTSRWFIQSRVVNKKRRIVHGHRASNINCIVVFIFDVCRLSWPVSLTNYDLINCVTYQIQRYISEIIWNTPRLTEFENRCFESLRISL